jgi:hypothetical protein
MLLRDHPLKSRHGVPNWPPVGTWIGELENTHPKAFSSRQYHLVSNPSTGSFCALTSKIHLTPAVCCLMIMLCANRQQSTSFNLLQWFHPDVGLASSFSGIAVTEKRQKSKGGKKRWKQNKK